MRNSIFPVLCFIHATLAEDVAGKISFESHTNLSATNPTQLPVYDIPGYPGEGNEVYSDDQFPPDVIIDYDYSIESDVYSNYMWFDEWSYEWQPYETCLFCSEIKERRKLSNKLLDGYNKRILPYSGKNAFNISINVSLVAAGDIDETEEKLSTVLWLIYRWNDDNFKWKAYESRIKDVTFGWEDVWKPVLRVDNPHADSSNRQTADRSFDTVIYNSEGTASFDEMMVTRTTCDLDMTYYPFDIQTCSVKLSVVGASKCPFQLNVHLKETVSQSNAKHGSWILVDKSISSSFGRFEIKFKFKRLPLFILLNILLPIIVIALLTPIVFVLPKKSGERVGFSITMLLAISVYMTIVSDHLPQNSEPMPLILVLMFIWYIMDAIIVFIVIINSKINTMKKSTPFPDCLRTFVHFTNNIRNKKGKHIAKIGTFEEAQTCIDDGKEDEKEDDNQTRQRIQEKDMSYNEDCEEISWQDLSHCIDRWCFLVFYFIKITLPVVFFIVMKCQSTL